MAGGMTVAVRRDDGAHATLARPGDILTALGLEIVAPATGRGRALGDISACRTPGLTLFAARALSDVAFEHVGAGGLAFVILRDEAADADGDEPCAQMIVPNGRRARAYLRRGDTITGVAFSMARLRGHRAAADRPIAGGVHDLAAGEGGARAAALGRLLAFFTNEASFGWSLLEAPSGLDYLETTLFALLAEGAGRPVAVEVETSPAPRHLRRAEAYIRDNLASELSVDDLARMAGVSERSLYRAFNDFRGMSVRAYVQNARMEAARRCLLERPDMPLGEVARRVGYADYTSFWRHYRSRFGNTPSAGVRDVLSVV